MSESKGAQRDHRHGLGFNSKSKGQAKKAKLLEKTDLVPAKEGEADAKPVGKVDKKQEESEEEGKAKIKDKKTKGIKKTF